MGGTAGPHPLAPSPASPAGHRERHVTGGQPQQLSGQPADHAGGQPDPERQPPARPGAARPCPGPPGRPVPRHPPPEPAGPRPVQPARAAGAPAQPQQRGLHQPGLHPPRLHGPLGRGGRGPGRGRRGRGQRALRDPQQPLAHLPLLPATSALGAPVGAQVQQHQQPGRRPWPPPSRRAPRPGPEPLLGRGSQQRPAGPGPAAWRAAARRRGQQEEEMRAAGPSRPPVSPRYLRSQGQTAILRPQPGLRGAPSARPPRAMESGLGGLRPTQSPDAAWPRSSPRRYMYIYICTYRERQTYIYIYFFYREHMTSRKC